MHKSPQRDAVRPRGDAFHLWLHLPGPIYGIASLTRHMTPPVPNVQMTDELACAANSYSNQQQSVFALQLYDSAVASDLQSSAEGLTHPRSAGSS